MKLTKYLISICIYAQLINPSEDQQNDWYATFKQKYNYYLSTRTPEQQAHADDIKFNIDQFQKVKDPEVLKLFSLILKDMPISQQIQNSHHHAISTECKLPDGTTPVTFAILLQNKEKVRQLVQQGFRVTKQDFYKAEFLINNPHSRLSKDDAKFLAFLYDHIQERTEHFIKPAFFDEQAKRAPETTPDGKWTKEYLLSKAAQRNDVNEIRRLIIEQRVNPNESVNCIDPLEIAVIHQNIPAMQTLIELGARPTNKHIQQAITRRQLLQICHEGAERGCDDPYPGPRRNFETDNQLYTYIATYLCRIKTNLEEQNILQTQGGGAARATNDFQESTSQKNPIGSTEQKPNHTSFLPSIIKVKKEHNEK